MVGLGTVINVAAIVVGGLCGRFFGRFLRPQMQETLNSACGVSVLFIGIAGALEGMLSVGESGLVSGRSALLVISMALGALIGEIIDIERRFDSFGEWLKIKTGNARESGFVNGFVSASLTVCIGAMAIVGSIRDGLFGDYSVLLTKAVLDLIIILIMTCSLGKGCVFSAIPVGIVQGLMTLLAGLIRPLLTNELALSNLSLVGSVLIFCVGLNLIWGRRIRVANLLPSLIFAVAAAYLPWQL